MIENEDPNELVLDENTWLCSTGRQSPVAGDFILFVHVPPICFDEP